MGRQQRGYAYTQEHQLPAASRGRRRYIRLERNARFADLSGCSHKSPHPRAQQRQMCGLPSLRP
jgi:hypothetical protein